jgi:hypothetical protein
MRVSNIALWLAALSLPLASPALAQVQTVDPNVAMEADLSEPQHTPPPSEPDERYSTADTDPVGQPMPAPQGQPYSPAAPAAPSPSADNTAYPNERTYKRDDVIGAAEGVFGKGAEGLAGMMENILRDQGEPSAYIAGREASGAFIVGLRYGSGDLYHKVEGKRPVYWTGPSIGFDAGADADKVFVLIYNLYDSQELYKRFPAGEGRLYLVGGFSASYLRRGDVVLIPVRLGVGWRAGANVGYMKFSEKSRWLPF